MAATRQTGDVGGRVPRLAQHVLRLANCAVPRTDFVASVVELVTDLTGAETVEIRMGEDGACTRFLVDRVAGGPLVFDRVRCPQEEGARSGAGASAVRCGGAGCTLDLADGPEDDRDMASVPLRMGEDVIGWLRVGGRGGRPLGRKQTASLVRLAETLGVALVNQSAQAALRERVKELTGLYRLSQLAERPDMSLDRFLQGAAELLPPAWQYPEITVGRIVLDGHRYASGPSLSEHACQRSTIVVGGRSRGAVEVVYTELRPDLDEGPFLREERSLLDAIAREVAVVVERRQAREERGRLEEQLLRADRLATLGQLAAGVAHEVNEPLGAVLGFAQLARKTPELPPTADRDLGKIEAAALYAREIVRKLMLFARQAPPRMVQVDLNQVVSDGLSFLESRWGKRGIQVVRSLHPDLPAITADPAQLQQVLVNLVVNAEQAMPDGGTLTLATVPGRGVVRLRVGDTGVGMDDEVRDKVFLPFFTTKDVNEGTGLGLAVVHGIVTAHGGSIRVESVPDGGSTFEVALPAGEPAAGH